MQIPDPDVFLGSKTGQNGHVVKRPVETCKVGKFVVGKPPAGNVSQTLPPSADYTGGWDSDPLCLGGVDWNSCRDGHTGIMCQVSPNLQPSQSKECRARWRWPTFAGAAPCLDGFAWL